MPAVPQGRFGAAPGQAQGQPGPQHMLGSSGQWVEHKLQNQKPASHLTSRRSPPRQSKVSAAQNHPLGRVEPVYNLGHHLLPNTPARPPPPPGGLCPAPGPEVCLSPQGLSEHGFGPITTDIREGQTFYYAEDYHQQYLSKNPDGYCGLGGTGVSCPLGVKK